MVGLLRAISLVLTLTLSSMFTDKEVRKKGREQDCQAECVGRCWWLEREERGQPVRNARHRICLALSTTHIGKSSRERLVVEGSPRKETDPSVIIELP